jgi:pentatricopeptide repeat protein
MAQAGVTANRASFETLLQTVGSSGRLKSAEEVFNEMKVVGVPPRTATYNFLIEACGTAAQPEVQKAFAYVEEMKKTEDAKPNVETYVRLINTASRVSCGEKFWVSSYILGLIRNSCWRKMMWREQVNLRRQNGMERRM